MASLNCEITPTKFPRKIFFIFSFLPAIFFASCGGVVGSLTSFTPPPAASLTRGRCHDAGADCRAGRRSRTPWSSPWWTAPDASSAFIASLPRQRSRRETSARRWTPTNWPFPSRAPAHFSATIRRRFLRAPFASSAESISRRESPNAPNAALYGIENTNRGCTLSTNFIAGQSVPPARSISGATTGLGIATGKADVNDSDPNAVNPGGVPLFRNGSLVGGIGVAGVSQRRRGVSLRMRRQLPMDSDRLLPRPASSSSTALRCRS